MKDMTSDEQGIINTCFNHHAPDAMRVEAHQTMRGAFKTSAQYLMMNVAPSRERSLALTKLEEAMFWANAAIARGGMD